MQPIAINICIKPPKHLNLAEFQCNRSKMKPLAYIVKLTIWYIVTTTISTQSDDRLTRGKESMLTCGITYFMRHLPAAIFLISVSTTAQNLKSGGALKPEQAIMDIRHYTVELAVDPVQQSIKGFTIIKLKLTAASPVILLDFWHGLTVDAVTVNKKKASFDHSNEDELSIKGDKPFAMGDYEVKVSYAGKPSIAVRPPWTGGFQWATDGQGNPWIGSTSR